MILTNIMRRRLFLKTHDELEVVTNGPKFQLLYKPGRRKRIKRRLNKRERKCLTLISFDF